MIAHLRFTTEVLLTLDTDLGTVTRSIVYGPIVDDTLAELSSQIEVLDDDLEQITDPEQITRLYAIADRREWPAPGDFEC